MADFVYSVRPNIFVPERTYQLDPDALVWKDSRGQGRLPYQDIFKVRTDSLLNPVGPIMRQCVLHRSYGTKVVLKSTHYIGLSNMEDRSASYRPFVDELLFRVAVANPHARFMVGLTWPMWMTWLLI